MAMCSRRERDTPGCARSTPPLFHPSPPPTNTPHSHGYGATTIHRADVVSALYAGLAPSASSKILTNKALSTITPHPTGITVTCTDGTTHHGTILIGADGVHSTTRSLLRTAALEANPPIPWTDAPNPFPATYQLLFGAFPTPSPAGLGYDIQAKDKAIMYLSGHTRSWFFLYRKLPNGPTTARSRYTDADIQAVAAEFMDFPLTDKGVKVKDVWPTMLGAGLTDLGEGIASRWSLGRSVLVGDACHKFTTHLGLGFNNGVQDVVVLVNMLRAALEKGGGELGEEGIKGVFEGYEKVRKSSECSMSVDAVRSGQETRMHAWANAGYYLLSRWVIVPKFMEDLMLRFVISPELRKGRVLDFVAGEEPMMGRMSWLYPMKR